MPEQQISSSTVKEKTGKSWDEWFNLLDANQCEQKDHKEIVAVLKNNFQVSDWWQQMITVTYEQARGKRLQHQRPDGFQISKSKTYSADINNVYQAWADADTRTKWLENPDFSIRKSNLNHSLRITWVDGFSSLEVAFYPKGEKTQVSLNHSKLIDSKQAEEMKKYWAEQLTRLTNTLE